ncbi:MAG: restriction endonuclease subunit S [Armatimonadetes bacterium]|nr:restriction endonuclease subunit S [Armatimonadota bacterium]
MRGEWPIVALGDIAEVRLGKMLDKAKHRTGRRLPYLRNINVRWGYVDTDDLLEMFFKDEELERYGVRAGDVLVCEGGEPGRAAVWDGRITEIKYQKALHRVRFNRPYEARLFVLLLQWLANSEGLSRHFTGSTIKHFTREAFVRLPVPVPPIEEQRELVAEIEKQFTRLDAGVAALKQAQAHIKRCRASVLKAACEGRLVPTEAKLARREGRSYETGAQLLERILQARRDAWAKQTPNGRKKKYVEPQPPDTTGLPELPEGWVWATVGQLAAPELYSITDGPFGSNLKTEHYTENGPRVVRLQNIADGTFVDEKAHISPAHFQRLSKHHVFNGDLVIAALGEEPPRACVIPESLGPAIVKADCIRFRPHPDVCAQYLNTALNSKPTKTRTKKIVHGVGRPRLNLSEIKAIAIPIPPSAEQQRIVSEVDHRLSELDDLEATVAASLQRAGKLRQAVLRGAFSATPR